MTRRIRHRLGGIAVVLTVAALLAPAALADPPAHPHDYLAAVPIVTEHSAGQNGSGTASVPIVTEHSAGQNGTGSVDQPSSSPVAAPVGSTSDSGFAWGDAAVGAAFALLVTLLAGGAVLAVRKRGTPAYR